VPGVLAWMDLEMTGLDPTKDVIVEVATIITDDDLQIIEEGPDLVVHASDEQLAGMDPFVVKMHTNSGLLEAIKQSPVTPDQAREETLRFLQKHIHAERTVPLCGNSIGTDRRFLSRYWPEIEEFLHYRSIDVSTVKELARRWYKPELDAAPEKGTSHRALDDIRESIAELQYYRKALFK
jgi:oligoribonuclease